MFNSIPTSLLRKTISLLFILTLATLATFAAPPVTIPPLTSEEKEAIRSAQVDALQASSAYQTKEDQARQQLMQTQEYKNRESARAALDRLVDQVFTARKLTQQQAALCDGPDGRPACAEQAKRELKLVAVPAPKEEGKK